MDKTRRNFKYSTQLLDFPPALVPRWFPANRERYPPKVVHVQLDRDPLSPEIPPGRSIVARFAQVRRSQKLDSHNRLGFSLMGEAFARLLPSAAIERNRSGRLMRDCPAGKLIPAAGARWT